MLTIQSAQHISKKCSKCKTEKLLNEFNKDISTKDGLQHKCKLCQADAMRQYRESGKLAEAKKKYRQTEKGQSTELAYRLSESGKEAEDRKKKKYRQSLLGKITEKLYEIAHPRNEYFHNLSLTKDEQERKRQYLHSDRGKEIKRAKEARRRAIKNQAGGTYTADQFNDLCKKYSHKCLCCGKISKLTADHVVPIALGGTSNIDNIQPLCDECNRKKGTKVIDYRRQ